jgi:hypothetical protein
MLIKMYLKNQWIENVDRLNVQVNVQLLHDESKMNKQNTRY